MIIGHLMGLASKLISSCRPCPSSAPAALPRQEGRDSPILYAVTFESLISGSDSAYQRDSPDLGREQNHPAIKPLWAAYRLPDQTTFLLDSLFLGR